MFLKKEFLQDSRKIVRIKFKHLESLNIFMIGHLHIHFSVALTAFFKHRLEIHHVIAASCRYFFTYQMKRKPFLVLGMFRVPKGCGALISIRSKLSWKS